MEEVTKAFKKVNSTVPAELLLSTSLLQDSSYSSSDSKSQSSCSQDKQFTHSEFSSVVMQVDVHNAKGQSNVQHVSACSREGIQLADMAKDKHGDPQDEFAMDTDRLRDARIEVVKSLAETPWVRAKISSIQENLGAVGSHQSSQLTLGGGMHSVSKEVPLIAHSKQYSMRASSPLLDDTLLEQRTCSILLPRQPICWGHPWALRADQHPPLLQPLWLSATYSTIYLRWPFRGFPFFHLPLCGRESWPDFDAHLT